MKKKKLVLRWLRLSLVAAFNLPFSAAFAQGTAFTYQGRLQNNGAPANGLYDLQFTVLGAFTNGVIAGGPLTNSATTVSNGLFTVVLDFGAGVFTGADRWLEIAVRTNGAVAFSTLQPRQQLTPSPYAIQAASAASLSGAVSDSQLPADVARLGANNNFTGTNGLNDADLRLRSNGDVHHGLGWYGGTKTFGTFSPDGPVLFGNLGGGLGAFNSGPSLVWNSAGKVGIGPNFTAPADFLHVQAPASLRVRVQATSNGFAGLLTKNSLAEWFMGVDFATNAWELFENLPAVGLRLVVATNGNVGIGGGPYSYTPAKSLQIGDATVPGSEGMIRLASRTSTPSGVANRVWDIGVPQTGDDATGAGYSFVIDDILTGSGPEFMVKWGTGNVGIGTTNPSSSLEVNGGIHARGGTPGALGGNNNGYAFTGNGGDNDSGMFSSANGQVEFYNDSVEAMRIANGNVGIGTTTPASRLDVRGGGVLTDNVFGFANVQQGPSPVGTYVAAPAGDTLALYTASAERLRVTPAGRLGIGTNNPQSSLHVAGDVTVNGNVRLGSGGTNYAPSSAENLRIVQGTVTDSGAIYNGSGFTVVSNRLGLKTITFTPPFSNTPVVVATGANTTLAGWNLPGSSSVQIVTSQSGTFVNDWFSFIAIGPP